MSSLFCRHNRFTADCPICARGTVLDPERGGARRPGARGSATDGSPRRRGGERRARGRTAASTSPSYAKATLGPYEDETGTRYTVSLERVPGGLRLAEWAAGELRRRAPRLPAGEVPALVAAAAEREVLVGAEAEAMRAAAAWAEDPGAARSGASPGRSGELVDELRVEPLDDGLLRVARWILRPGTGWEPREAPVMLPAARYTAALADAGRTG